MCHRKPGRDSASDSERGQSLVIVVLLMFGMIAFLGLVIDGGGVFMDRRRAQDASDGAAFAGARQLALRPDDSTASEQAVWDDVVAFAKANGVASGSDVVATFLDGSGTDICQINVNCGVVPTSPLATGVRVTTTLDLQLYFISLIIGKQPIPVSAVAAVQTGPPTGASNLMPMTIKFPCPDPTQPCFKTDGTEYQLFGDPQSGGNFQWTNYDNPCVTKSPILATDLYGSGSGTVVWADPNHLYMDPTTPAWICGFTGVDTSDQVRKALDWWLAKPESERHWIIPVTDDIIANGSNTMYHVIMFADFVPDGYDFGGQNNPSTFHCSQPGKCIEGRFFKQVEGLEIVPGKCNLNGADICGMGLSQ